MSRRRKKSFMGEPSTFGQEELYYMVEFLTKQRYDNLPPGTNCTSTVKRRIMIALSNRLEHKCGVKRSVRQLQKRWSDMKRRETDFLLQVQWDISKKQHRREADSTAVVTVTEPDEEEVRSVTDYAGFTQVEKLGYEQLDAPIPIMPKLKVEEPDTYLLDDLAVRQHPQADCKVERRVFKTEDPEEDYYAAEATQSHKEENESLDADYKQCQNCPCGILQQIYKELAQQGERLRKLEEKVDMLLFK
ncbi:uncharacterized protein RCH25_053248 [Pelodytes ibericus]